MGRYLLFVSIFVGLLPDPLIRCGSSIIGGKVIFEFKGSENWRRSTILFLREPEGLGGGVRRAGRLLDKLLEKFELLLTISSRNGGVKELAELLITSKWIRLGLPKRFTSLSDLASL